MWLCWRTRALSTAPSGSRSASNAVRPCLTVRLGLCRGPPNPPALVFATPSLPGPTESPISDTPWPNSDLSVDTTLCTVCIVAWRPPHLSSCTTGPCTVSLQRCQPTLAFWRPVATPFSLWLDPSFIPFLLGNLPSILLWKPNLQDCPLIFLVDTFSYKPARPSFVSLSACGKTSSTLWLPATPACQLLTT